MLTQEPNGSLVIFTAAFGEVGADTHVHLAELLQCTRPRFVTLTVPDILLFLFREAICLLSCCAAPALAPPVVAEPAYGPAMRSLLRPFALGRECA